MGLFLSENEHRRLGHYKPGENKSTQSKKKKIAEKMGGSLTFAEMKKNPNLEKHSILSGGKWHEKKYSK